MVRGRPMRAGWSGIVELGVSVWSVDRVAFVVTCLGTALAKRAFRPACLVVGHAIQWRCASCVATMAGGRMGNGGRRKKGRPRRGWEDTLGTGHWHRMVAGLRGDDCLAGSCREKRASAAVAIPAWRPREGSRWGPCDGPSFAGFAAALPTPQAFGRTPRDCVHGVATGSRPRG